MNSIYDFSVKTIKGANRSLNDFKGRTLLIVNTASQCGFTKQYEGLEKLYKDFHSKGFDVLAFPCNQFGDQEPGSSEEIEQFCNLNYQTTFPLFAKIDVNGANTDPLFEYLKKAAPGILGSTAIKWNFTKFLVNKNGDVVKRYAPQDTPESLKKDIEALL